MMFRTTSLIRYEFNNVIDGYTYKHYIETEEKLTAEEKKQIGQLLASFPHANRSNELLESFLTLKVDDVSKKIIRLAANAHDSFGNTVLGVAAENGKHVEAVQRLIDMGALLDTPDHNMSKLALHWAINNQLSFDNKKSFEAVEVVKCLLNNGARTDITCYQNCTPLDYAKDRGFKAAAELIEQSVKNKMAFK